MAHSQQTSYKCSNPYQLKKLCEARKEEFARKAASFEDNHSLSQKYKDKVLSGKQAIADKVCNEMSEAEDCVANEYGLCSGLGGVLGGAIGAFTGNFLSLFISFFGFSGLNMPFGAIVGFGLGGVAGLAGCAPYDAENNEVSQPTSTPVETEVAGMHANATLLEAQV